MSGIPFLFASPRSIFRQLRHHQLRLHDFRRLVTQYRSQSYLPPPREGFKSRGVHTKSFSTFSRPCASFSSLSRPSHQTLPEVVTGKVSEGSSSTETSDEENNIISRIQKDIDDWWAGMEAMNSVDGGETDNVDTNDNGAADTWNDGETYPTTIDDLPFENKSNTFLEAKSKSYRVVKSLKPPDTTIYHGSKPTYFQWDYRNHPKMDGRTCVKLLGKIEQALKDAHLEPFGKRRGIRTVRRNILAFNKGTKFRLAQTKSFRKRKSEEIYRNGSKIPSRKLVAKRTRNLFQTSRLLKTMFQLIYERHTIHSCKHTTNIGELERYALGESFFGPTTHIAMTPRTAKMILRELWLHGRSRTFSVMQRNHNVYQAMLKRRIRAEWLNQ